MLLLFVVENENKKTINEGLCQMQKSSPFFMVSLPTF
jgi:hypothetical protein